jgi:hypothetical protein
MNGEHKEMAGELEFTSEVLRVNALTPVLRRVGRLRSNTPVRYTMTSTLPQLHRNQCLLSDRRMPSRLEGQPECHEAHENPHRSADIDRHHREPCIRPNQRSNKRTESKICRSLAGT